MGYSYLEQFKLIVEQLEICSNLYKKKTNPSYRISLILLDNIAEIILHRYVQHILMQEAFTKWIVPPSISVKDNKRLSSYFDDKVKFARKSRLLSSSDALIIEIAHEYRNKSFHKDNHNPKAISILSRLLFSAVLNLFIKTNGGIIDNLSEGVDKNRFIALRKYGLSSNFISYSEAAKTISKSLSFKKKPPLSSIKQILAKDVEDRANRCLDTLKTVYPSLKHEAVDAALKLFEFKIIHAELEDELSKEIRQIRYNIGKGNNRGITKRMYLNAERKFKKRFNKELLSFKSYTRLRLINNFTKVPTQIYKTDSFGGTLRLYHDVDYKLSLAEAVIDLIHSEWDRAIQMEIDIRLGK